MPRSEDLPREAPRVQKGKLLEVARAEPGAKRSSWVESEPSWEALQWPMTAGNGEIASGPTLRRSKGSWPKPGALPTRAGRSTNRPPGWKTPGDVGIEKLEPPAGGRPGKAARSWLRADLAMLFCGAEGSGRGFMVAPLTCPRSPGRRIPFPRASGRPHLTFSDQEREILRALEAGALRSRADVARILGICETRVQQLEASAVRKVILGLRKTLRRR